MAKTRLNKEERRVIVRKIKDSVMNNYDEKKQKILDSYYPSETYSQMKRAIEVIKQGIELFQAVKVNNKPFLYLYCINDLNTENLGSSVLNQLKLNELQDQNRLPKYPNVDTYEIEDDIILGGIDPDWSVEQIIEKYTKKYID